VGPSSHQRKNKELSSITTCATMPFHFNEFQNHQKVSAKNIILKDFKPFGLTRLRQAFKSMDFLRRREAIPILGMNLRAARPDRLDKLAY
jgi:hypothetical protein